MVQVTRYTKEELLTMLYDLLEDGDVLEVAVPARSLDQISIIRNPDEEETE